MIVQNFQYLASLLKERSGLIITESKGYLVESRLMPIVHKHGLQSLDALAAALRTSPNGALVEDVVDAMTTNETSFFRDRTPFESLSNSILPRLIAARATQRSLRIWSAACSTGQEPYSLSILLRDRFPQLNSWRVEIIATDISPSALQRARDGLYTSFEVQRGLPAKQLVRFFEKVDQNWRVIQELRSNISFRHINLLEDITTLGRFDVIMCRNVLIYFDLPAKRAVLDRMATMLFPDGALFLGGSESIFGVCSGLEEVSGVQAAYAPILPSKKIAPETSVNNRPASARTAL